ncbi:unnamed protein product [Eruca vesicaria subsp. sativa]|uniref:F-box domain-containing protein n=1 Tax=Eruca vesicaria subsp. sativa TaxID=29727 RepID=A0ABC8KLA8_ERUVS|nr:unnamed protein product [Eruca vesicaria subsp. sativa]
MNRDDEQPQNLQSHSFSSLPDEIIENILARVSRYNYPSLSLVSKRFHSLLSSPQLYMTRSHIRTTEPCLYLCLKHSIDQPPRWYSLWMKSVGETLIEHEEDNHVLPRDDYSLFPVPSSSSNPLREPYYTSVAVGSELYVIGGSYKAPSSAVRILDCRTHTWRDGPSMLVARWHVNVFLLDEKIYVMSHSRNEALDWIEVLDIKTQTWRHVRSHGADEFDRNGFVINVFEGKICAIASKKSYAYDPLESRWEVVEELPQYLKFIRAWCVIEDVKYCFTNSGDCKWYDSKAGDWIDVKGSDLKLMHRHRTCSLACRRAEMHNLGGKLLVMWTPVSLPGSRIWCAKMALEKRGSEVWGKIEWANSVSQSCWFSSCVVSI